MLLVNRAAYGIRAPSGGRYLLRWSEPREGEIVVFRAPDGRTAVKRCAPSGLEGYFLAFGDNPSASWDSRSYGPVPVDAAFGRVVAAR